MATDQQTLRVAHQPAGAVVLPGLGAALRPLLGDGARAVHPPLLPCPALLQHAVRRAAGLHHAGPQQPRLSPGAHLPGHLCHLLLHLLHFLRPRHTH